MNNAPLPTGAKNLLIIDDEVEIGQLIARVAREGSRPRFSPIRLNSRGCSTKFGPAS